MNSRLTFMVRCRRIGQRLRAEQHITIAKYALDELSLGILWMDPSGKVLHANKNAEKILSARDGVFLQAGELRIADRGGMGQLSRSMKGLVAEDGSPPALPLLRISRPSDREPYTLSLVKAAGTGASTGMDCIVAYLTDPSDLPDRAEGRLSQVYGLTASEAAIAMGLARGQTVEELATARKTSVNTVRHQTKQVMAKLGVKRQADVIRAVVSMSVLG